MSGQQLRLPLLTSRRFELPSVGQLLVWPLLKPFFQQHHQLEQPVAEAVRSNIGVLANVVVPDVVLVLLPACGPEVVCVTTRTNAGTPYRKTLVFGTAPNSLAGTLAPQDTATTIGKVHVCTNV